MQDLIQVMKLKLW